METYIRELLQKHMVWQSLHAQELFQWFFDRQSHMQMDNIGIGIPTVRLNEGPPLVHIIRID